VFLKIDPSRGVPIYRQIMDQIKYSIASAAIRPGDRLPSVRQLSLDLKVNPATIVKAYSELEHEGIIHTRRGMGTFVSEQRVEIDTVEKEAILGQLAERLIVEAVQLGVGAERILRIVEAMITRYMAGERSGDLS